MKRIITLMFALILTIGNVSMAQEISELKIVKKPVLISSELVDRNIKDVNGEVCGMIQVLSDLDGLSFNSYNGMCRKIAVETGKYKVFLSPNERVLEVMKTGYKPMKIILSEVGIIIESGKVWELEISGDKKLEHIAINIVPSEEGAEIFIDGESKGTNKTHQVTVGKHEVRLIKTGFKTIVDSINVSLRNIFFSYQMERIKPMIVTIKSNPDGAAILLNGSDIGKRTNAQHSLIPGKYIVRLQKFGFFDYESEIDVKDGSRNEFNFSLNKSTGTLNITVIPPDAELLIDGEIVKPGIVNIKPGEHSIEIRKQNHISINETIVIKTGESLEKSYTLENIGAKVILSLIPPDAEVEINMQKYPDVKNISLAEGSYLLEVKKEGYKTYNETIELKSKQAYSQNIILEPLYGSLQIIVQPIESNIRLLRGNNVIKRWNGSIVVDSLLAGGYTIEVEAPGYVKTSKGVIVKAQSLVNEEITLEIEKLTYVKINYISPGSSILKNVLINKNGDNYDIKYDLSGDFEESYNVELFLLDKSNPNFERRLEKLNGSVGEGKFAGRDNTIVWNALLEFPGGIQNDNLFLKITAEEIGGGIPWYLYVGGAVLGGSAAALLLGKKSSEGTQPTTTTVTIPTPPSRPSN